MFNDKFRQIIWIKKNMLKKTNYHGNITFFIEIDIFFPTKTITKDYLTKFMVKLIRSKTIHVTIHYCHGNSSTYVLTFEVDRCLYTVWLFHSTQQQWRRRGLLLFLLPLVSMLKVIVPLLTPSHFQPCKIKIKIYLILELKEMTLDSSYTIHNVIILFFYF